MSRRKTGDPEALARSEARIAAHKAAMRSELDGRGLGPEFEKIIGAIPRGIRTSASVYMDSHVLIALKFISEKNDVTLQKVMREALDLVIEKYAKVGASRGKKRQRVDGADRVSRGSGKERAEQAVNPPAT